MPAATSAPMIELLEVTKVFDDGHTVLEDLSLQVRQGSTLALVGPSGCGKTTTLKLINRLESPSAGRVHVSGTDVATVDPVQLRRSIGYVVQEAGLFPHMTAEENVDVVPRLLGWSADKRRARARELMELVGLEYDRFHDRYGAQMSGGQRQRVGLARALAGDPEVVLMDEPFGALDPIIRRHLQGEFRDIVRRLGKTVVVVTHDMEEALHLADQVAILNEGHLEQIGTPDEIRDRPATAFVSEFMGTA